MVAKPEIPLGGGDVEFGVRRHHLVELDDGSPEMVGMAVSENDLRDFVPVDARFLQIVPEPARGRHEAIAGTHVDKDQFLAGPDQRDIGG